MQTEDDDMDSIGDELKRLRKLNGYSQSAVAKTTGINQQMISWWEAGKGYPGIEFCIRLADFYGVTLDELVGRDMPAETSKTDPPRT